MELNPNHEVTKKIHDHWHKIAALIMHKVGVKHLSISEAEIKAWANRPELDSIVIRDTGKSLEISLVPPEEGKRLAELHGGLPD